ncbi:recF protein [Thermanaerovibrio velox DSM 12556]|uniref:DNA replication and repair protein RecF n=1 Tax=Thermanaerovibrio velox DSM 12556 TaxID=926567 RepID=H0UMP7_9BACT|nr:DNA replication and repair protein RecF [Thermanaerovibrio velox]EHM09192.1 recF protein [Thermanaerovibrio velox DSM 12556]
MRFKSIKLYNYRNLKDQALGLSGGLNIFSGPNGAGKTNLLEAFCVCSGWGAFDRTSRVVRIGSPMGAVRCEAEGEEDLACAVRLSGRASLRLNGERASGWDVRSRMPVLAFLPENLTMVEGPPSCRRRLMDLVCAICYPDYAKALHRYGRALRQRTASLRSMKREVYTLRLMAAEAAVIWASRISVGGLLTESSVRWAGKLGIPVEADLSCQMAVRSRWDVGRRPFLSQEEVFNLMMGGLEVERRLMRPPVGPHRDDLRLTSRGREASWALSRGQRRRLSYALVMGAAETVLRVTGRSPVVVLDEVFSELDGEGRRSLFLGLRELSCQVLASTAEDLSSLGLREFLGPGSADGWALYRVEDGSVAPLQELEQEDLG